MSLKHLGKIKVEEDPLKSVAVIPSAKEGSYFFISGGLGEQLNVHLAELVKGMTSVQISSNAHNGSINCIKVSPGPDNHFASGGSQGELSIWQIP